MGLRPPTPRRWCNASWSSCRPGAARPLASFEGRSSLEGWLFALTLREENGQAVLTIVDDGPGIPAEHARTIFERFSRLDSARSAQTGGVGLGLPITRDIVNRHHGTVLLRQCDGPGATFEVRLPLA